MSHMTRTPLSRSKVKVTRPLWLVVLAGQHGHTVMVTYPYAYMTYIVSPLAGLGGGISWQPPAYSLLRHLSDNCTLYNSAMYFFYHAEIYFLLILYYLLL